MNGVINQKQYYRIFSIAVLLVCFVFAEGQAQTNGEISDARQAIDQVNVQFMQAWKDGNAAGVANLYAEKGLLLVPHAEALEGRQAITKYIQGAMNGGIKEIKLETIEFDQHGDIAHERGQYELYTANGQVADHGKYMIVWKKQDGNWKIHWDMINTNRPTHTHSPQKTH